MFLRFVFGQTDAKKSPPSRPDGAGLVGGEMGSHATMAGLCLVVVSKIKSNFPPFGFLGLLKPLVFLPGPKFILLGKNEAVTANLEITVLPI